MMDRFLQRFEGAVDPFGDERPAGAEPRRVGELTPLPADANRFIWFFARQAKWPLIGLLVTGGLTGLVEAALYTGVGSIVDALTTSQPDTLLRDHGWMLAGLLALVLSRRGHWIADRALRRNAWRLLLAAAIMGGILYAMAELLFPLPGLWRFVALGGLVAVGLVSYFGATLALGAFDLREFLRRRRRRSAAAA